MRRQLDNMGFKEKILLTNKEYYDEIFSPNFSRRQTIALSVFIKLNRERDFDIVDGRRIPNVLKTVDIKKEWSLLAEPIRFDFLLMMIQAVDDVFCEFSMEQLKNG